MARSVTRPHGSDASLSIGFLICLVFTLSAYGIVTMGWFGPQSRILVVVVLAFLQFVVQIYFFLHLGREPKPRWKLGMFIAMIFVVLVVVIGSLWIMHNLDYNMMNMTPEEKAVYMSHNEGL